MLKLKQLSIQGFRSFTDKVTVDFPDRGLVCIQGVNKDTGGSSGSGKSSLFHALAHLLGYAQLPTTTLQSWGQDSTLKVIGVFQDEQAGEVIISRTGSKLGLKIGGEKIPGSASHLEDQLNRILRVDPKLLGALTYRPQKTPSLFLSLTDSKKKEFLCTLLNLNEFEIKADLAAKEANRKEIELGPLEQQVKTLAGMIPVEPVQPELEDMMTAVIQMGSEMSKVDLLNRDISKVSSDLEQLRKKQATTDNSIKAQFIDRVIEAKANIERLRVASIAEPENTSLKSGERIKLIKLKIEEVKAQTLQIDRDLQSKVSALTKNLTNCELAERELPRILKELEQIEIALEAFKNSQCPTCNQTWENPTKKEALLEQRELLLLKKEEVQAHPTSESATQELAQAKALLEQHRTLDPVPPEWLVMLQKLETENKAALAKYFQDKGLVQTEHNERLYKAEATLNEVNREVDGAIRKFHEELQGQSNALVDKLTNLKNELGIAQLAVSKTDSEIKAIDQRNKTNLLAYQTALKTREAILIKAQEAQAQYQDAAKGMLALRDFAKMVGREGFLGLIFDEVLGEISNEANNLLVNLPNVQHLTVEFSTQRTMGTGATKNEIQTVILQAGVSVPFESLSGGQQTGIEMAVDRAVARVAARRSGVQFSWLVLDEAFDGFDNVVKENCLEILKQMAQDQLVLVVDHSTEFKQLFDSSIQVVYQHGSSRIIQ